MYTVVSLEVCLSGRGVRGLIVTRSISRHLTSTPLANTWLNWCPTFPKTPTAERTRADVKRLMGWQTAKRSHTSPSILLGCVCKPGSITNYRRRNGMFVHTHPSLGSQARKWVHKTNGACFSRPTTMIAHVLDDGRGLRTAVA